MVALFESIVPSCTMTEYFQFTPLVIGFVVYTKAFLRDIKAMLDHVNQMSKDDQSGSLLIAYFNETLDLHARLNRYFLDYI